MDDAAPPAPASLGDRVEASLAAARDYLVAAQGDDGAWRSGTYAAFRDGYSLSPLVLASLFALPDTPARARAYARGVDFVASMVVDGRMRADAAGPRYPQYSSALAVVVFNLPGNERHRAARDALAGEIRRRQLASGGWGYFDPTPDAPANLSATLYAVGALYLAGTAADDPAMVRARAFVDRCQGADGGFHFSPDMADGNKAGADPGGGFRSYGSMTADGARALLRLGASPSDARVTRARAWLERRFEADRNPGDFPDNAELRRASSYYYYAWTVAHALRHLGVAPERWAEPLARELLGRQADDGSWRNRYSEMRENEPLVATAFAAAALAVIHGVLVGPHRSHAATR